MQEEERAVGELPDVASLGAVVGGHEKAVDEATPVRLEVVVLDA